MVDDVVLECNEMQIDAFVVPSFAVSRHEMVGLGERRQSGDDWVRLMATLTGSTPSRFIRAHPSADYLVPFPSRLSLRIDSRQSSATIASCTALSTVQAESLLRNIGLDPLIPLCQLRMTERLLLGIEMAHAMSLKLVALSVAGLDPIGIKTVLARAAGHKPDMSFVCLFAANHRSFHESLRVFDKIVEVMPVSEGP